MKFGKDCILYKMDSYKAGHYLQYPKGMTNSYSYIESRGGIYPNTLFFGLQGFIKEYLAGCTINKDDVLEAEKFFISHGVPFNTKGWMRIAEDFGGKLPVRIKAVKEGEIVPTQNILVSIESTDPETCWLPSYLETSILRGVWFPTTVATLSHFIKKDIYEALQKSSDDPDGEISFKLHSFAGRGVSSSESAGCGDAGHLISFMGSDTVEGIVWAQRNYDDKDMLAFSIKAMEHSSVTSWGGQEFEADAYQNMIDDAAKPGAIFACVSDSYDIYNAIEHLWGEKFKEQIEKSGATCVIRLDSGSPADVVLTALQILEKKVGMTVNSKGYKVLPSYYRLLQGDGVNHESIKEIMKVVLDNNYSMSNLNFGMGGALLQQISRDTQKFAMKCSSVIVNGEERDVFKNPITDPGKRSKAGRLALIKENDQHKTVKGPHKEDLLQTVFENGQMFNKTTMKQIRERAWKK